MNDKNKLISIMNKNIEKLKRKLKYHGITSVKINFIIELLTYYEYDMDEFYKIINKWIKDDFQECKNYFRLYQSYISKVDVDTIEMLITSKQLENDVILYTCMYELYQPNSLESNHFKFNLNRAKQQQIQLKQQQRKEKLKRIYSENIS